VAVASDLRFAMDEIAAAWRTAHPAAELDIVYGSSGNFFAQISEGAPYDIFFSADSDYPRRLEANGRTTGLVRIYGMGRLALWTRSSSGLALGAGLAVVAEPSVEAVAIANPEHAPYGRAAVEALQSAGLYEAVEPKLVLGENVSQAAQFAESGSADVGIIALSLALSRPLMSAGRHVIVPTDRYRPLEQAAVVLASATDGDMSQMFVEFVLADEGRAILDRYGLLPPT